jgi:hypothetical protein
VEILKRWLLIGLLLTTGTTLTGCGLDDAQETSATYINAFLTKAKKPSAAERYEKLTTIVSANNNETPIEPAYKEVVIALIQEFMQNGIEQSYFIGNAPNQPQTETKRTIVVHFPKGSFKNTNKIFNENISVQEDTYAFIHLQKEGDDWKVSSLKQIKRASVKGPIDWEKVDPTDYLD